MLYAALTFWLLVIAFSAAGVHKLWSRLIKPKVVNTLLLPGTLVAQLGHVLGLLVTGNSVQNTRLMGDDEAGEPQSTTPTEQRIPVIGPIIVGLLPLLACGTCLYIAAVLWGDPILVSFVTDSPGAEAALPLSLGGVWALLRDSITLVERLVEAIGRSDLMRWSSLLFLYLAVCLTVRMAPFEDNRRGAIGAILLAGVVIWIVGALSRVADESVRSSWPILSFAVAMLLLLLLVSLAVTGLVGLVRILAGKDKGG